MQHIISGFDAWYIALRAVGSIALKQIYEAQHYQVTE
jgi:hypothetical protein